MVASGDTVGGWTLGRKVGSGGQGKVYTATQHEGKPEVAIKLIKASRTKKRARFIHELEAHARLSDQDAPNIMPILEHNLEELENGGVQGYVVMPLAESNLMEAGPSVAGRVELCLEVFEGIVNGVWQAEQLGIVHRDIKPGNVLFLDRSLKEPLISDFGICLLRNTPEDQRLTDTGETVGAKFFMAPEQERGGVADVGHPADVYALGKLLHFMLTGRTLYREKLDKAFLEEEIEGDPRLKVILDSFLKLIVVEDPDSRIQSAEEVLAAVIKLRGDFSGRASDAVGRDSEDDALVEGALHPQTESEHLGPSSNDEVGEAIPSEDETTHTENSDSVQATYREFVERLLRESGSTSTLLLEFDEMRASFELSWSDLYSQIEQNPNAAEKAAEEMVRSHIRDLSLSMAICRTDSVQYFRAHKGYLEWLTRLSENKAGYRGVISVPHVHAGFIYMISTAAAMHFESWSVLEKLLTQQYEWYYQSGRPHYSFGFSHSYFFHPDALERRSSNTHDFFRSMAVELDVASVLGLSNDKWLDLYLQAHMIMCLRGAQLQGQGEDRMPWPDFGRFYDFRVEPVLYRIKNDPDYAEGLLRAFGETTDQFVDQIDERLATMVPRLDGGYFWESVTSWPREK